MAIAINGTGTITGISVGGLNDSIITSSELANAAVTTAKIADDAVTSAKAALSFAVIADVKPADTNGGTFTSGAWRTRDLNTEIADADSIVSISSNQFTLIAGTYLIQYAAPAYAVSHHRARLYDITNTVEIAQAVQGFAYPDPSLLGDYNTSIGSARVSIASSTTYEIQHICNTTASSNGFGLGTNMASSNCQYTTVTILRLG